MNYTIQQLPLADRPRERLLRHGPEYLSTVELIAIILSSGTKGFSVLDVSRNILSLFSDLQTLSQATIEELCQVRGLGKVKAMKLKSALCLGVRATSLPRPPRYLLRSPLHVYQLLKEELERETHEKFLVILQDAKGAVIRIENVAQGSLTQISIEPRDVFYPAIRYHAVSIILVHNHPSGDPSPSEEDIEVTQLLIRASQLMQIPINDHIILGKGNYKSIREMRLANFLSS